MPPRDGAAVGCPRTASGREPGHDARGACGEINLLRGRLDVAQAGKTPPARRRRLCDACRPPTGTSVIGSTRECARLHVTAREGGWGSPNSRAVAVGPVDRSDDERGSIRLPAPLAHDGRRLPQGGSVLGDAKIRRAHRYDPQPPAAMLSVSAGHSAILYCRPRRRVDLPRQGATERGLVLVRPIAFGEIWA